MRKYIKKPVNWLYENIKEVTQEDKENPSLFQGPLERAFRTFTNIDSSTPESQPLLRQQSAPKLEAQLGPQSLMPQLLEVAFGILNNWDQAEEEDRNWRASGQATAQAKLGPQLSAVPCNLRTTQGVPRKFSHLPGGKTSRGNASNVSQPVTEPENVKKNPLVHVLSADKSVIGSGTALSPEGEGTAPTVEMATMDDWGGLEIPAALPTMRYLSLLRSPGWSLTWQVKKSTFKLIQELLNSILTSHPWPISSKIRAVTGVNGVSYTHLLLRWASHLPTWIAFGLTHFSGVPECSTAYWEETLWAPSETYYD